jgi:secernin
MMVALGSACAHGHTLFGVNLHARPDEKAYLRRMAGGVHAHDEIIATTHVRLPQARQTCRVLGLQPVGAWGLRHGVNEHGVAVGVTGWHSKMPRVEGGLTGSDLVRLVLERSHSSLQAVDVLTDLINRYGQCGSGDEASDNIFLIADPAEAYVVEAAGRHWALIECRQTRAVTDVALTRQDWRRLAPGLAGHAIEQGWWSDDGSKLDFAGCLDARVPSHALARRRWGRASVALAQQAGAIDSHFFRRLLDDHFETNEPLLPADERELAGSFLVALHTNALPVAWCSFGSPQFALYFPLWPLGELPSGLAAPAHPETPTIPECARQFSRATRTGRVEAAQLSELVEKLQVIFDQEAEQFQHQAHTLRQQGSETQLATQATALMQRHVELFEREWRHLHAAHDSSDIADWADEQVQTAPF